MDITPVYELKARLRAAAIAGTDLLSEDFRLKKAAESFAPLAKASPVFARINEMTEKLLNDGTPENLLDTITLVDAVITTLGAVEVAGEPEDILVSRSGTAIVNAPYSQLSAIIDALTTSGSGNYNTVLTARRETPELFNDYRVRPALVGALGASYSELADTAANILKSMGKEVIPLIKKDFDPKGKKETIRRLKVIEDVCGAEENDFYLEQLENSEKDVRKALIYALRHDKKNIDRLIELSKTEKGSVKTAALSALIKFDNEKTEEFFNEYSEKKPAEVMSVLERASSGWTSGLAARLIRSILVDKDGNPVTLSEVMDGKIVLKSKVAWFTILDALWGKWGAEIENIYREIDCKGKTPVENTVTMRLSESIAVTDDDGLKALAAELNNAPKTKDCYIYPEAVSRLISHGDSSKWFAERILAAYKRSKTDKHTVNDAQITKALRLIFFDKGGYYLVNRCYDPISDGWLINEPRKISSELIKGAVTDALLKCPCWENNRLLGGWIDENDKEYCEKLGRHFIKQLTSFTDTGYADISELCGCVSKCGLTNVKNLAVDYFKNIKGKHYTSWVNKFMLGIPGDDEYKLGEARAIIEIAKIKKYDWFDINGFEAWADRMFKHD